MNITKMIELLKLSSTSAGVIKFQNISIQWLKQSLGKESQVQVFGLGPCLALGLHDCLGCTLSLQQEEVQTQSLLVMDDGRFDYQLACRNVVLTAHTSIFTKVYTHSMKITTCHLTLASGKWQDWQQNGIDDNIIINSNDKSIDRSQFNWAGTEAGWRQQHHAVQSETILCQCHSTVGGSNVSNSFQ